PHGFFGKDAGSGMKLPLAVVGFFAKTAGSRLCRPSRVRAEYHAALQVLNEDREHTLSGLPVLGKPFLKERVGVRCLDHRELDNISIVLADAADDLAVAADFLSHAIAVRVDADKAIIDIAGYQMRAPLNRDFLTVVGFDLAHCLLSSPL